MTNNDCTQRNTASDQAQIQDKNTYNVKTLTDAKILLSNKSIILDEFYKELLLKLDTKQPVENIELFQKTLREHERDINSLCHSLEVAKMDSSTIEEDWKVAYSICQRHESKITDLNYRLDAKRKDLKRDSERNVIDVTAALIAISLIPNAFYNWIRQLPGADDRVALAGSFVAAGIGLAFALRKEITSVGKRIAPRNQTPKAEAPSDTPRSPSNVIKIRKKDREP